MEMFTPCATPIVCVHLIEVELTVGSFICGSIQAIVRVVVMAVTKCAVLRKLTYIEFFLATIHLFIICLPHEPKVISPDGSLARIT